MNWITQFLSRDPQRSSLSVVGLSGLKWLVVNFVGFGDHGGIQEKDGLEDPEGLSQP